MIVVVFAHPYPNRSRANRVLLDAVRDLDGVQVRSLYERYPDFDIDVAAEQRALESADLVVWQHPMYWYATPGLLKHWFDKVLSRGWAYGEGGKALLGKRCLWVVTTGGDESAFTPEGIHAHPLESFVPQIAQTARFCGMRWEEPLVVHGAHLVGAEVLEAAASRYRLRLEGIGAELREGHDGR